MTRKKVRLTYMANESARIQCLKKRRLGLLKKVSELATLCDIKAFIIIYSPNESEPLVWPSHAEVQQQLEKFHNISEQERIKKAMNQETYLRERVIKGKQQMSKFHFRNKGIEMNSLMHQVDQGKRLDELSLVEQEGLIWFVEEKMNQMRRRMEFFQRAPFAPPTSHTNVDLPLPFPLSSQGHTDDLTTRMSSGLSTGFGGDYHRSTIESLLRDQWFTDKNHNELNTVASRSSIRGDMGLSCHPFAGIHVTEDLGLPQHSLDGSSYVATDIGQSQYGTFRGPTTNMGLSPLASRPYVDAINMGMMPPLPSRPYSSSTDIGLPYVSLSSSNFVPSWSDIGQRLHPSGHIGSSSSTGSDIRHGLQYTFEHIGSSSVGGDIGQGLQYAFGSMGSSSAGSEMGLPHLAFRPQSSVTSHMGLPNYGSVRNNDFGPSESGIGLGQRPFGQIGSSSAGSELGQPFVPFGGSNNSGTRSDIGLPFHGNTWPTHFSS